MSLRRIIFLAALFVISAAPRASAWTQDIYVWQRRKTPELQAALAAAQPLASGFNVLAAEVSWSQGRLHVARFTPDYGSLAALGRPVGLSLRIGPFPGPFARDDATASALTALVRALLAEARTGGLSPCELQIDFDCAEGKLAGYRRWLEAFRPATDGTPLVLTALPVWLDHEDDFAALAHATDGFVLQVHSLAKPQNPDAPFTLCEPARAEAWAGRAGRVGVPFRVALPTYGYRIAFDAQGKFSALAAEGGQPAWPAGTQVRSVRTDAIAIARLAQTLRRSPPPHCLGVIWFRLPLATDRLNWDMTTFATVLRGEMPSAKLEVEIRWPEPGLAEVSLVNTGTTTETPPARVSLAWPQSEKLLTSDGLEGFRLDEPVAQNQASLIAATLTPDAAIAPGHHVKIAWLRFSHDIVLTASLPAAP